MATDPNNPCAGGRNPSIREGCRPDSPFIIYRDGRVPFIPDPPVWSLPDPDADKAVWPPPPRKWADPRILRLLMSGSMMFMHTFPPVVKAAMNQREHPRPAWVANAAGGNRRDAVAPPEPDPSPGSDSPLLIGSLPPDGGATIPEPEASALGIHRDPADGNSGPPGAGTVADGARVLVISSGIDEADALEAAARQGVIVVRYDPATVRLDTLAGRIRDALAGQRADRIAFAAHNAEGGRLILTREATFTPASLSDNPAHQAFWTSITGTLTDKGRIDLLGCNVGRDAAGAQLVSRLEALTGINVAASADPTGNPDQGGDWVLESDGVDVRAGYFDERRVAEFEGVLLPPMITGGSTHYYTEGDGTLIIDPTVQVTDPDSANLVSARVTISSGFSPLEDQLAYGGTTLTGMWDSNTGMLNLTGTASLLDYQSALRTVTYENLDTFDPTATSKIIDMVVNDGVDDSIFGAFSDIVVIPINDPPLTTAAETLEYTAGAGTLVLDPGINLLDDSFSLCAATVAFAANYVPGEDYLSFVTTPSLTYSWDPATGVLTITGSDTPANYQMALGSITYENTNPTPSTLPRPVTWEVSDCIEVGNPVTTTIYFTRAPHVTAGNLLSYNENDGQIPVDPGIVLADDDSTLLQGATVTLTDGFSPGEDVLAYSGPLGSSWDAAAGILTLAGPDILSNYEAALRSVAYENVSENPSTAPRVIQWSVNDGVRDGSATSGITINAINDPPLITAGDTLLYAEGAGASVLDATVPISEPEGDTLKSASVAFAAVYAAGEDFLAYAGGLTATYDSTIGLLTLTGADTAANYQAALESVTYENVSDDPNTNSREIAWTVSDGTDVGTGVSFIDITPVNDAPLIGAGNTLNYTENSGPVAADPTASVADPDNTTLQSATIAFSAGFVVGEDMLAYSGSLSWAYDSATGVLTLAGSDSVANYQAALALVTYENLSDRPSTNQRTLSWTVNDGFFDSASAASWITISPVNDAPFVSSGQTLAYTENDGPVAVDPAIGLTDVDSTILQAATVSLGATYIAGEDMLSYSGPLAFNWGTASGVLTLSGPDTVANYEAALASVRYENLSNAPNTATRTVNWTVSDGIDTSPPASSWITISPVNDAPIVSSGHTLAYTENAGPVAVDPAIGVTDVDSFTLQAATVSLGTTYIAGEDMLTYSGPLAFNWDTVSGVLTLSGPDTVANYEAALRSVTYENISEDPSTALRVIQWSVSDGLNTGAATSSITINSINDPPTAPDSVYFLAEDAAFGTLVGTVDATDPEGDPISYGIVSGNTYGIFAIDIAGDITVADNSNLDCDIQDLHVLQVEIVDDQAATSAALIEIHIDCVNSPPVVTAGYTQNYTEGDGTVEVAPAIGLTDVDSPTLQAATVSLGTTYIAGEDMLSYSGPLASNWDTASGVLTLSGPDTVANYEAALASVRYENLSNAPNTATRTVNWTVSDGIDTSPPASSWITISAVNDPPIVSSGHTLAYTENAGPVAVDPAIEVTDVDSPTLQSATVSLGSTYIAGEDVLAYTGALASSWDTVSGILTISGSDTIANYSAALASVSYANLSEAPATSSRTVTWTASDGINTSAAVTAAIDVVSVNDPPVITGQISLNTAEETPLTVNLNDLTVDDPDDTYPSGFVLELLGGGEYTVTGTTITPAEDFNGTLTVPATVNDGAQESPTFNLSVAVLPVNDPPAIVGQAVLSMPRNSSLTIEPTDLTVQDPDNLYPEGFTLSVLPGTDYTVSGNTITPTTDFSGTLSVPVIVNDGADDSPAYPLTVEVVAANSPPTIQQGSSITVTMDEDGAPTPWSSPELSASDPDDDPLTWEISAPPRNGSATIGGTGTVPVVLAYTPSPDFNGADPFVVGVSDGNGGTATVSIAVTINPVNDAPFLIDAEDLAIPSIEEDLSEADNPGVQVSEMLSSADGDPIQDPDGGALEGIAVIGTDGEHGRWQYDIGSGFEDFPAISEDSALLLDEAAIIRFLPNADFAGEMGSAVSFRAWDRTAGTVGDLTDTTFNGGTSAFSFDIASVPLTITPVNDPPKITDQATLSATVGTPLTITLGDLSVTDPDNIYPDEFQLIAGDGAGYTRAGLVITPTADAPETIAVPVRVNDGTADSPEFPLSISVSRDNQPPVADAGPDLAVRGGQSVTLDGTRSHDPDGTIAQYRWEQISGPAVDLAPSDAATAFFTAPDAPAELSFRLTVVDENGARSLDDLSVEVDPAQLFPITPPRITEPDDGAIFESETVDLRVDPLPDDQIPEGLAIHWRVRRAGRGYGCPTDPPSFDHVGDDLTGYTVTGAHSGGEYIWQAGYVDPETGDTLWSEERTFTAGAVVETHTVSVPPGETIPEYRMVAFPIDPGVPAETMLDGLSGIYDISLYRIGTYDPLTGGYIEFGEGLPMAPGRSIWVLARNGLDLTLSGVAASPFHDQEVELLYDPLNDSGWNMIAAPNGGNYPWGRVELLVYNDDGRCTTEVGPIPIAELSEGNPWVDKRLWRWENGEYRSDTDTLEDGIGYWVRARDERVVLRFPAEVRTEGPTGPTIVRALKRGAGWLRRLGAGNAMADDGQTPPLPPAAITTDVQEKGSGGCFIETGCAPWRKP